MGDMFEMKRRIEELKENVGILGTALRKAQVAIFFL
jgi:hypothetical protein